MEEKIKSKSKIKILSVLEAIMIWLNFYLTENRQQQMTNIKIEDIPEGISL